jgi:hypothetical protein
MKTRMSTLFQAALAINETTGANDPQSMTRSSDAAILVGD